MIKDKNSILNDLMDNAVQLIAGKIQYTQVVLEQFEEKNDAERVKALNADIEEMTQAMNTIKKRSGCWAQKEEDIVMIYDKEKELSNLKAFREQAVEATRALQDVRENEHQAIIIQ